MSLNIEYALNNYLQYWAKIVVDIKGGIKELPNLLI